VQIGVFVLSAALSLAASAILVTRLERIGERLGLTEAMLGLLAALAADGPEITASISAIASGRGTVGIGVTLGSNVFNLAALLGLGALVAGRIALHRREILLEGGLGLWLALVALAVVTGNMEPSLGLLAGSAVFVPYVVVSAMRPSQRARVRLPGRWSAWLARALAEEESELAAVIHARPGDRRDAFVALAATVVVIAASVALEEAATDLGSQAGLSPIVVGGLVLAAATSLPNAVAATHLARQGRGAATLSVAFNSNALNVLVGLLVPAAIMGLVAPSEGALFVALAYLALATFTVALALRGRGLDRRAGSIIILGYVLYAAALVAR
jgi:cation:H+ antiporter